MFERSEKWVQKFRTHIHSSNNKSSQLIFFKVFMHRITTKIWDKNFLPLKDSSQINQCFGKTGKKSDFLFEIF